MTETIPTASESGTTFSVKDTFAEAFPMTAARVIVTAETSAWAAIAGQTMTGYATSVIACDAEAGIERVLEPGETPDGRSGVSLLVFAFSRDALEKAVSNRVGQCVMTCPTTACYNGLPIGEKTISVGGKLRYFGDGWQISKRIGGRRYWRIPVMDGEFLCEETFGTMKGRGRRQYHHDGQRTGCDPGGRRGRCCGDEALSGRHPAVPRRDRALRLEGGQQVQGSAPARTPPLLRRCGAWCRPRCPRMPAARMRSSSTG